MYTNLPVISAAGYFLSRNKFSDQARYHDGAVTKLRTVKDYEIELYSEEGGISHLNGKSYPIRKGCLLIAQPGDKRKSTLHFSAIYIHFGTSDPAVQALIRSVGGFHNDVGFEKWEKELNDICQTALRYDPDQDIYAGAKLISFLCRLKMEHIIAGNTGAETNSFSFINAAIEYMKQAYAEQLTMDQIASHCGFSTSYLHKLFLDNVHMTPNNFLLNIRFSAAKKLLTTTTMPISEVAAKCGFNSQSYFCDCFKKRFSVSPREFRNSFYRLIP